LTIPERWTCGFVKLRRTIAPERYERVCACSRRRSKS
jgi:hypothetical protein